ELRRGGTVMLQSARHGAFLVLAAETIEDACLARLRAAAAGDLQLVLTAQRTAALGLTPSGRQVASLLLPARLAADGLRHLADPTASTLAAMPTELASGDMPAAVALAAIDIAKLARLLPAAVLPPLSLPSPPHS